MVLAASRQVSGADESGVNESQDAESPASDRRQDSASALESLCELYWPPLYAFAIRRGHGVADAQDLTQEFFSHLLQSDFLGHADAGRGRFRTFLLTVFERFAASQWRKASAQKRGGDRATLRLDFEAVGDEGRFSPEPAAPLVSPDRFFQQQWALTLLGQVVDRLRSEYSSREARDLFEALESQWNPGAVGDGASFVEVATRLGMTTGAVKVAAHRLRSRYRTVLRQIVLETVADESEVEDEIHDLMNSFSDSV